MIVNISIGLTDDKKFDQVTADLKPYRVRQLKSMEEPNSKLVVECLISKMREGNVKAGTRANTIDRLSRLSLFHNNKPFSKITKEDVYSYLDTIRRTESDDPMHKWISTYNLSLVKITSFLKWLYEPQCHSKDRKIPSFLTNLTYLKRKEKTTSSAKDLWTQEEDSIFLKYCPDKRLRLYHIMARETSGRPHELLALKIGDIVFQKTADGRIYATITIGKGGKTIPRTVPIINSIPYLKDWLATGHPHGESKNHFLFLSMNRKSIMRNKSLDPHSLNVMYSNMKTKLLPRVIDDGDIPNSDKEEIRELLNKPFYPYLRRHIGISEMARNIPDHSLRVYSGWVKSSRMVEIYTHELGDEVSNQILELKGYSLKGKEESNILKPKICNNCGESNKPDSQFCFKCKIILSYAGYMELVENKNNLIESLKEQVNENTTTIKDIVDLPCNELW